MKYTLDYATHMPTREKQNKLSHVITSMRYGLISHVTPSGITFREIRADIQRNAYREILLYEYEV